MKSGRSNTGRAVIVFMAILGSILIGIGIWVLLRASDVVDRFTREPEEPVVRKDDDLARTQGFGARDARVVLEIDAAATSHPVLFARANGRVHAATDRSRDVSPFVTVQLTEKEISSIIDDLRSSRTTASPGMRMRVTTMRGLIERSTFDVDPAAVDLILERLVRRADASRWIPATVSLRAHRTDGDDATARWPLGAVSLRSVVEASSFESKDFDTNRRILENWPSPPLFKLGSDIFRVDAFPIP